MLGVSKTELNLSRFTPTLTFIGYLEIYLQAESKITLKFWKDDFGEVMEEMIIWSLRTQYMATWL